MKHDELRQKKKAISPEFSGWLQFEIVLLIVTRQKVGLGRNKEEVRSEGGEEGCLSHSERGLESRVCRYPGKLEVSLP